MSRPDNPEQLDIQSWDTIQTPVDRFKQAWQKGIPVALDSFLPPPGDPKRTGVLRRTGRRRPGNAPGPVPGHSSGGLSGAFPRAGAGLGPAGAADPGRISRPPAPRRPALLADLPGTFPQAIPGAATGGPRSLHASLPIALRGGNPAKRYETGRAQNGGRHHPQGESVPP